MRCRGFILKETAAAMIICLMLAPAVILCLSSISGCLRFREEVQDRIALSQLRRILMLSYDVHTEGNTVRFSYQNEDRLLRFTGDWLLISPGTEIMLAMVEGGRFIERNDLLYVIYERKGKQYEAVLCPLQ